VDDVHSTQAVFYDETAPEGKVALVLGAGNVASIGPLDVVYKLFVEGQVCLLKMNPVNDYLGVFIEEVFADFVKEGFLEFAYGGADVGAYLCQHEGIDEIHITGSDKTHDAIVYGVGDEGQQRKKRDERLNTKRITSELGNVSPVIVIPGLWSAADLRFHAENIVTQMTNNGSFNCNAARVLITDSKWPLREQFVQEIQKVLGEISPRTWYYPGATDRYQGFVDANQDIVQKVGQASDRCQPWAIIPGLDSGDSKNICFTTESFCGVLGETSLDSDSPSDFLKSAVSFCNDTVWGTLNAEIIVDPKTQKQLGGELETAIENLRYGSVVVNHWPALSYALGVTTWGAFPGHTFQDIRSGVGVVHNTFLFDRPQKSVIWGPFRVMPKPPWFVTNKNAQHTARRLLDFETKPGIWRFLRVVMASLRG
jgi:acyl-CoA reductase-like NAD-dependent aldehyde dehydrogenase